MRRKVNREARGDTLVPAFSSPINMTRLFLNSAIWLGAVEIRVWGRPPTGKALKEKQ